MSYHRGKSHLRQTQVNLCRRRLADVLPSTYGWEYSHDHPEYGLPVYTQQDLKLMRHPTENAWVVQQGDQCWKCTGTIKQVTADFFRTVEVKLVAMEASNAA